MGRDIEGLAQDGKVRREGVGLEAKSVKKHAVKA
jgi:hypothetical protein